ncbi:Hsp33 family molecular chaperone [Pelagibacterium lacus]|uniref:Hsp33 family molecular chaperone n=1 Tax=Pelagibacterium lacus TaxID=2282655 RepID=A0A369W1G0_9HYPH|nr:Hsp33 family molecular chaperone [Pelagibacterium lacus]RDE08203.1 Hsp33 family molecular chaperone [Pelagibacterium lacus]
MSELSLEQFGLDRPESGDDVAVPFTLETLDSRGRVVHLGDALDVIINRHGYPEPVARLLGEATTLAALIGSSLKFEGRFILQSRTDGPVSLLVVDFDTPDGLRAYARYDEEALAALAKAGTIRPQDLLGKGILALTVDQGAHMDRYQGIVALEGESLEEVAHTYFMQSEQIPTRVRLAVAEHSMKGQSRPSWRAGGVLLQHLPEHGGRTMPDLPGDGDFDNPETADTDFAEDNRWAEARALMDTLSDAELADPDISPERLLFRLYHETGVRVFEPQHLVERCTCSAERVEQMIYDFTPEDRADMVVDGQIEVVCEFCSTHYHFNPNQF